MQKKHAVCIGLILLVLSLFVSIHGTSFVAKIGSLNDLPISKKAGPEITNVVYTPEKPEWYDNITITAKVTDPWGILDVWISYDAQNDAYAGWGTNYTMSHIRDDLYTFTIYNSIWDFPNGPAFGANINFTIYAKNGKGIWGQSGYYHFYMNDTVKPVTKITLNNNSWISGVVQINTTVLEEGSGLKQQNLSIYMGNGTLFEQFTSTNLNETYTWDVSSLPDYNVSEPTSYFTMNFTAWDKATPSNYATIILDSINIDNTPPSIALINSYKNLTAFTQDNQTITNNLLSAADFTNSLTSTYYNDSNYHSFYNGTEGLIQVAYGFNLTYWNLSSQMLYSLKITIEGKIGYSTSSILEAGWKIWNWVYDNFTTIDSTIFNNTKTVSDSLYITSTNKSFYINSDSNHRVEIFLFVNTTGPPINASVDYLNYDIGYYEIDDWYNREKENITLQIIGSDLLSFDYMELFHENFTYYRWNTSGTHLHQFNTTVLPDGSVPLNLTVYDKAGNSNSSSIILNVDYLGPLITIISPENNSYIGESQIWNLIVPIEFSGYDIAKNFRKIELLIDGQIAPVREGQLGQIVEYDAYGNVIYEQNNATWYREGNYTYYWNASNLNHGSQHVLLIRTYDGFNNPREYCTFVTMANFVTNISLVDVRENYTIISDNPLILEFSLINYGNTTLQDFLPQLIIPSSWDWSFKDIDYSDFNYLNPGGTLTFKIELIPRSVDKNINQSIDLLIICSIVENLTQSTNNYTTQLRIYVIVQPPTMWQESQVTLLILISIAVGLGTGLLSWLIYRHLRELSKQPQKPIEKPKKER